MIKSSLWLIVHKYYFLFPGCLSNTIAPSPCSSSFHFFLAKRPNFFSLSFLAELGSGRAVEEEGAGRLWALAPEGPDASSAASGWTAFSMAWLQRWSSSSSLHWNKYSLPSPRLWEGKESQVKLYCLEKSRKNKWLLLNFSHIRKNVQMFVSNRQQMSEGIHGCWRSRQQSVSLEYRLETGWNS